MIERPVYLKRQADEEDKEYYARIAAEEKVLWEEKEKTTVTLKELVVQLPEYLPPTEKKSSLEKIKLINQLFADKNEGDSKKKLRSQVLIDENKACLMTTDLIKTLNEVKDNNEDLSSILETMHVLLETRAADVEGIQKINNCFYEWDKLKSFTYQFTSTNYSSYYMNEREDVINEVFQNIFDNIRNYDGSCDITTFALRHIKHAMSDFISRKHEKSRYYNEIHSRVHKVIQRLMTENPEYSETDIPIARIQQELPDLSHKQIFDARNVDITSKREAFNPDFEAASFDTPEKAFEEEQDKEYCRSILSSLTELQRVVLNAHVGNWEDVNDEKDLASNQHFINLLIKSGFSHMISKDEFGKKSVSLNNIKILLNDALNAAREVPVVNKVFQERNDNIAKIFSEEIVFDNIEDALKTQIEIMEMC